MAQPKCRRRTRTNVVRHVDCSLFDTSTGRPIILEQLADHLRTGGIFDGRGEGSGADCTIDVLHRVLAAGSLPTQMPGTAGGTIPGLRGLNGLLGGLPEVAQLIGERLHRGTDRIARRAAKSD